MTSATTGSARPDPAAGPPTSSRRKGARGTKTRSSSPRTPRPTTTSASRSPSRETAALPPSATWESSAATPMFSRGRAESGPSDRSCPILPRHISVSRWGCRTPATPCWWVISSVVRSAPPTSAGRPACSRSKARPGPRSRPSMAPIPTEGTASSATRWGSRDRAARSSSARPRSTAPEARTMAAAGAERPISSAAPLRLPRCPP